MTIKTRIIIFNTLSVLLVALTLMFFGKLIMKEVSERFENSNIDGTRLLWNTILENQMDNMESNITALARDKDTREALRDLNSTALAESIKTSYNLLNASGVISGVELADSNGKIVASAPGNDDMNRSHPLIVSALQQGKVVRGLIAMANTPVIAVAFPLYIRGQSVGGGVYYLELKQAVEILKKRNESEVVLLDKAGKVIEATDKAFYDKLGIPLPAFTDKRLEDVKLEANVYSVAVQAIPDFNKQPVMRLLAIKDYTESFKRQSSLIWTSIGVTVGVVAGMLVMLVLYTTRAFNKLHNVITVVKDVSACDLTHDVKHDSSNDETGQLNNAMHKMVENLSFVVKEIHNTAAHLASSSSVLSDVADQTNSGIQQQLSETDMVATAINELSATAQEVAKNAADVATAANAANDEAQQGSRVSKQLLAAINEQVDEVNNVDESLRRLQSQTNKISEVVTVISGIAEQINLLALNAAIEAARAGEQGRGFAVVADEVRTLANRTQASTSEISDTITQLQNETNKTVGAMNNALDKAKETESFVADTTERLRSIAEAVDAINSMIMHIATATEEQTSVTEEINVNVTSIKTIAERASAGSLQTRDATTGIMNLSHELETLISRFKLK